MVRVRGQKTQLSSRGKRKRAWPHQLAPTSGQEKESRESQHQGRGTHNLSKTVNG